LVLALALALFLALTLLLTISVVFLLVELLLLVVGSVFFLLLTAVDNLGGVSRGGFVSCCWRLDDRCVSSW
jgi:hypothetical protein